MFSRGLVHIKRFLSPALLLIAGFLVLRLLVLKLYHDQISIIWPSAGPDRSHEAPPVPDTPIVIPSPRLPSLPQDYQHLHDQKAACGSRLGPAYLEGLRHTRATYCAEDSRSHMTCFHTQPEGTDRTDSFCIATGATFDRTEKKFHIPCDLIEPQGVETKSPALELDSFNRYWYDTGPHTIMEKYIDFGIEDDDRPIKSDTNSFTVLVKREGPYNLWHGLMEIMSLTMTLDVLQMTPRPDAEGAPFLTPNDAANTQVVMLDDADEGPYYELWQMFSKKPTIRLSDLPLGNIGNIIIPLPGGSNPVWQSDWKSNSCDHSDLIRAFSYRVLNHFNIIDTEGKDDDKVIVTIIHRLGSRKLLDIESHVAALQRRCEHARIQLIDLASLSFPKQVQLVRDSDVLAGVHGAGLTHTLWMRERSAVVEILPENFQHKGFRNLAGALGHDYFSTHGSVAGGGDWQQGDVALDEDRFLQLMDVAIKTMYNSGRLDIDVN